MVGRLGFREAEFLRERGEDEAREVLGKGRMEGRCLWELVVEVLDFLGLQCFYLHFTLVSSHNLKTVEWKSLPN